MEQFEEEPSVEVRFARRSSTIGQYQVKDHFSLNAPTSTVAFKDVECHIFQDGTEQLVLEKEGTTITAKKASESTPGLFFMRLFYTVVSMLMAGFLFIFSIQVVLFLFLGVLKASGNGTKAFQFGTFFGSLLTIPVICLGLANAMNLATAFVIDTFYGQRFMKKLLAWDSVVVDWISVSVYVLVPIIVASLALYAGSDSFWDITTMTWFICVFVYYSLFALVSVYYEIDGCYELIKFSTKLDEILKRKEGSPLSNYSIIKQGILLSMRQKLSGAKTFTYIAHSEDPRLSDIPFDEIKEKSERQSVGLYSRIAWLLAKCGIFTELENPKRYYSADEVRDYAPYITSESWGLERLFFRNRKSRYVAVISGDSALTKDQVLSSFACNIIGTFLVAFTLVAFLVWMNPPTGAIILFAVLFGLWIIGRLRGSVGQIQVYKKVMGQTKDERKGESGTLYQVEETFRMYEAGDRMCFLAFIIIFVFFFVLPLITLFFSENYPLGFLFIPTSIITGIRYFFNSASCAREIGSLDGIEKNNKGGPEEDWREKHRLSNIISQISSGPRNLFWIQTFAVFIAVFCMITVVGIATGTNDGDDVNLPMASGQDFYYPGSTNLEYATCTVGKGITKPAGAETSLADYIFLSGAAYSTPQTMQEDLDTWFGEGTASVRTDIMDDFKASDVYKQNKHDEKAAEYKLVQFVDSEDWVLAIRGTSNGVDALTDAQLWSSAALAQYVRAILPMGHIFTPIFAHIVNAVALIQAVPLKEVAYYRETTDFINYLKALDAESDDKVFSNLQVTGHSLGGGLAMITGAQTETPAIGVSGPNAMISRLTFDPPITEDQLRKYTFNVVPNRDPVPMIDDLSQNYQRVKCRSDANDFLTCHFAKRTLCEVLYECGSSGRPIPCACYHEFGYEKPMSTVDGADFFDACPEESRRLFEL